MTVKELKNELDKYKDDMFVELFVAYDNKGTQGEGGSLNGIENESNIITLCSFPKN